MPRRRSDEGGRASVERRRTAGICSPRRRRTLVAGGTGQWMPCSRSNRASPREASLQAADVTPDWGEFVSQSTSLGGGPVSRRRTRAGW